jgi:hypothetical protein
VGLLIVLLPRAFAHAVFNVVVDDEVEFFATRDNFGCLINRYHGSSPAGGVSQWLVEIYVSIEG